MKYPKHPVKRKNEALKKQAEKFWDDNNTDAKLFEWFNPKVRQMKYCKYFFKKKNC